MKINRINPSILDPKMKEQDKALSWTPFSDNLKNNRTIVDNELEKSNSEDTVLNSAGKEYVDRNMRMAY